MSCRLTPRSLGLALSAFGWTYALFQIPMSRLVDKILPRYLMAAVLGLWSIGTFLNGFVQHFAALILIRMSVGALEAPSYPINNRVATTWFPESERASVIGFYTSGQFVGLAFLTPALMWLQIRFRLASCVSFHRRDWTCLVSRMVAHLSKSSADADG